MYSGTEFANLHRIGNIRSWQRGESNQFLKEGNIVELEIGPMQISRDRDI